MHADLPGYRKQTIWEFMGYWAGQCGVMGETSNLRVLGLLGRPMWCHVCLLQRTPAQEEERSEVFFK